MEVGRKRKERSLSHQSSFGPPEIKPEEVTTFEKLGEGTFGVVWRGKCRKLDVAIKILLKQQLDAKTLQAFKKEVEIMSKIYHPNIVLFLGACFVPGNMMIVTELLPNGNLETLLRNRDVKLTLLTRMRMALDVARGMTWLHGATPVFIHRDLKPSNLLLDSNYRIKLCDFGLSEVKTRGKNLKDGPEGAKGTPLWMAPEILRGEPFNEKADVHSFGIVLWELLTRVEPYVEYETFEEFRDALCFHHIRPAIPEAVDEGYREPSALPYSIKKLVNDSWHPHQANRPSFSDIVEQLNHCIVDSGIRDKYGQAMWKESFLGHDCVVWRDFIVAFKRMTDALLQAPLNETERKLRDFTEDELQNMATLSNEHLSLVNYELTRRRVEELNERCLHTLLAEKPKSSEGITRDLEEVNKFVSMERFGRVLDWFGPVADPRGMNFTEKITNVLKHSWFHGDISLEEAQIRLACQDTGTFLVRFSTTSPGSYAISKVSTPRNVSHQRILRSHLGHFIIQNRTYESLESLIKQSASSLNLVGPCPGSRYSSLFQDVKTASYLTDNRGYI